MIIIRTRIPCAIKPQKFHGCTRALTKLTECIHGELHIHHKKILSAPPVWTIELHAFDIENFTGSVTVVLSKSNDHKQEIALQYLITGEKIEFFESEDLPLSQWKDFTNKLIEPILLSQ